MARIEHWLWVKQQQRKGEEAVGGGFTSYPISMAITISITQLLPVLDQHVT